MKQSIFKIKSNVCLTENVYEMVLLGDTSDITVVDFTDDEQVADMIDSFNSLVNAYNFAVLLDYELEYWSDTARNEDNGPVFEEESQYLLGDVDGNGKVNIGDVAKVNAHVKGASLLTDPYWLECANVNGGKLNIGDSASLYAHIRGTKKLY